MAGEIKILEFIEGVTTLAPNQIGSYDFANSAEKTSSYVITDTDRLNLIIASGSGTTITLPSTTNNIGRVISIKRNDSSNSITIARNNSSDAIDGSTSDLVIDQDLKSIKLAIIGINKVVVI